MKLRLTYYLALALTIFCACSNPKQEQTPEKIVIKDNPAIPNTKSAEVINLLRPQSQAFQVNADTDSLITGKNGTQVFIPKNSFVNENGEVVTGKVDIELVEVLSVSDLIRTNLQTVSNGRPLQSEGMLYINAKSNGQNVALAKGKNIQIELPNMTTAWMAAPDIKIFSGSYDTAGKMNWTENASIDNKLVPLPLDLFDYKLWKSHSFIRVTDLDGAFQIPELSNTEVDSTSLKNSRFQNTFIATREFEERFSYIIGAEWAIGYYTSFSSTKADTGTMIRDSAIINIYLNNLDKDLWYCDSLALAYMKKWSDKAEFDGFWYSEERVDVLPIFKKFYEQRLTNVIKFPPNIDLSKKDARENLIKGGFKDKEIDEILGAYERQRKIVTARRDKEKTGTITGNSFSVAELGWINCDRFYDDPKAKEANIFASVSNANGFEFATLTLVINNLRLALSGQEENGKYIFTGKAQPYTKLPVGEKATVVGISYKDGKPWFGTTEITIAEKASCSIELKPSSVEEINSKLKEIQ